MRGVAWPVLLNLLSFAGAGILLRRNDLRVNKRGHSEVDGAVSGYACALQACLAFNAGQCN